MRDHESELSPQPHNIPTTLSNGRLGLRGDFEHYQFRRIQRRVTLPPSTQEFFARTLGLSLCTVPSIVETAELLEACKLLETSPL